MNIVVFDDEERSCRETASVIKNVVLRKYGENKVNIFDFTSPLNLENWLDGNKPDIAVLDISIPGDENYGIKFAQKIRQQYKNSHIIFLTSNEGKITEVFSGLIRPSQFIVKLHNTSELEDVIDEILIETYKRDSTISVSYGRNEYILRTSNIILIQKDGRKTSVFLVDRQIHVTDSLNSIAKNLPLNFIWVDKGVIVNLRMVREVEYPKKILIMADGQSVYMSRNSVREVRKKLKEITGSEKNGAMVRV